MDINKFFNPGLKHYLFSLRYYFLISVLIFGIGVWGGFAFSQFYSSQAQKLLLQLEEAFEPYLQAAGFSQVLFIFLKNSFSALATILLGIALGLFPILSLFSNGEVLGLVSFFALQKIGFSSLFLALFPHGILEIPSFLISGAAGIKLGKVVLDKIAKKPVSLQAELNLALELFLKLVLILLFISALVEVFISQRVLEIIVF